MLRRRLRSRPPVPGTGVGASTPPPGIPAHTGPHPPRHHNCALRRRTSRPRAGRGPEPGAGPRRTGRPHAMCHEVSCFVMVPYAQGSYPVAGPGMMLSFRTGASRAVPRFVRHSVFGIGLPFCARFVPFFTPPGSPQAADPFSRETHARACMRFAPARGGRRSSLRMPLPLVSSYHGYFEVKLFQELFLAL